MHSSERPGSVHCHAKDEHAQMCRQEAFSSVQAAETKGMYNFQSDFMQTAFLKSIAQS